VRAGRAFSVVAAWICLLLATASHAQPFQFSAGTLTNGAFTFGISAPLGRTYSVSASTNLTAWSVLLTNIVPIGPLSFVDTNASQFRYRFYRGNLYYTIIISNAYPTWQTTTNASGRLLAFPSGWQTTNGPDGRTIAFPPGWNTARGSDGRLIAFPPCLTNRAGADGRLVAYYPTNFTTAQGNDGRLVPFPSSTWTNRLGFDGRRVAYPSTGFSTTNGADGRLVAFFSTGETNAGGADGRKLAYVSGFTTGQGSDGRRISYPSSGWTVRQGLDGRLISYPTNAPLLNLDFQDQSLFATFAALKTILSPTNFNNYVIYTFFGTGDDQYSD